VWGDLAQMALPAAAAWLESWLPWCAQTGVRGLILHGGTSPDRRAGLAHTKRVFETVLPAFERQGVVLYLENHYAYDYHGCHELFSEPWEFREVFALNSPSLRFCFDTGHGNMTRNTCELLGELAPWLAYVHLADNRGVDDDHLAYGQGTVRWAEAFAQLRANGFDGTFCVEFPVHADEARFRRCVADLRRLWPRT
jgi:sugar phosphate isomerase/epimerase